MRSGATPTSEPILVDIASPTGRRIGEQLSGSRLGRALLRYLTSFLTRSAGRKARSLSVCETAGLGDRRFVAVVQADGERFLIAGGTASISLLAKFGAQGGEKPFINSSPTQGSGL